jgi:type I restriction enzyme S subunit
MSFPRYESYKDSGVKWLGDLPEHWDIFYGRRIFKNRRELASDTDEQLAASQKYGVIPQILMMELNDSKVMLALKGTESFRHVEKNDFVISLRSFEGGIEHSNYKGCVSPAYTVLTALKDIEPNFYRYLFKSKGFIAALQSTTDSLRDGKSITYQQFGDIPLALPSDTEQQAIATFLDCETAKIDALIAEQKKLIELLKEKRQAVISHAVTKGLNPAVPMKQSGIEWLGEVPEHWDICSLKRISKKITDGAHISPETENGVYEFVSTKDVSDDGIDFENCLRTSEASYEYLVRTGCKPSPGDVLFSKDGTIGRTVVIKENRDFVVASSLIIIKPDSEAIMPDFLNYLCQSSIVVGQVEGFVKGAGLPRLSIQNLLKIVGVFPPIVEQRLIVDRLNLVLGQMASLLVSALEAITLLQERRTALITAAVTGKIDVRGLVSFA